MNLLLSKTELRTLCDTGDRDKQMAQLSQWGIPYKTTVEKGNLKVLRDDVRFTVNASNDEEPNYGAA